MFKGKRALVTGAGRGIGRAIAIDLVKNGAHVIALSRTIEHLVTLKKEVPSIMTVSVDVGDWKKTEAIVKMLGPIDLLVNNAGISALHQFGTVTEEECDQGFAINVKAVINISQIVAKGMKARGTGGSIVNISSLASLVALPHHAIYCASKAALDQITKVMALELGPSKIRVNSVNPTVVLTEGGKNAWKDERLTRIAKSKIPLGKFCEPEDVVKAVIFLLSDDAGMITGVQLPIDGGYTTH